MNLIKVESMETSISKWTSAIADEGKISKIKKVTDSAQFIREKEFLIGIINPRLRWVVCKTKSWHV